VVTVRINSNGREIDVKGDVVYVKQNNDIGNITTVNSSFSWNLSFPKTPNNIRNFDMLGIPGSSSLIPYTKIECQILDNGLPIETNGNLIITSSLGSEYKGHVKAGIIDFIQDISTDNISDVIDLSSLTHINTPTNIINSFTAGLPYKYVVAYYNGQLLANSSGVTNLNPFALVPSIDVKYLWDKIFEHYGWTYTGQMPFEDVFMTYPNAIGYDSDGAISALESTYNAVNVPYNNEPPGTRIIATQNTIGVIDNDYLVQIQPGVFQVQESGNYNIKAKFNAIVFRNYFGNNIPIDTVKWQVFISGLYDPIYSSYDDELDFGRTMEAGTLIYIHFFSPRFPYSFFQIEEGYLDIETRGVQQVDFSEAFIKIKVKDFFKEVLIRGSLIPFVNVEEKRITFKTLDEMLTAPATDWSKKYVSRKEEKYVYNSYAQQNILKHKYNEENQDYANGVLVVDNQNQPESKDLYSSFTYAPEEGVVEYVSNVGVYYVQNFRMFDLEVQVDEDDQLIGNYKQLKDRFYFIKTEQKNEHIRVLGDLATSFPVAVYSENFSDIVSERYSNIWQLINNAKILTIELNLNKADIVNLQFFQRYYFEQEKAYFLLNKLTWKSGNITTAEFVKINS